MKPIGYIRISEAFGVKTIACGRDGKIRPRFQDYQIGELIPIYSHFSKSEYKCFVDSGVCEVLDDNKHETSWGYIDALFDVEVVFDSPTQKPLIANKVKATSRPVKLKKK